MISMEELKPIAAAHNGKILETLHQGKRFQVDVTAKGLQYTPESTGTPRLHRWLYVERVLNRFNDTNSFSPSDYHDISANATYLLALIKAHRA
ncbi:hypothetical protein [Citrifermentans bremense]|uniref:hypothetical protein n=1 Tax=Citrifermentans bremense TaxID=60035 RepID=UPI001623B8C7|nr:hypothetical protein [Citrifermentans bremense]